MTGPLQAVFVFQVLITGSAALGFYIIKKEEKQSKLSGIVWPNVKPKVKLELCAKNTVIVVE